MRRHTVAPRGSTWRTYFPLHICGANLWSYLIITHMLYYCNSLICDSSVCNVALYRKTTAYAVLPCCILQGASEDASPKKEKLDKGNENYQKVKEVRTLVPLQELSCSFRCESARLTPINPCGRGCHVFLSTRSYMWCSCLCHHSFAYSSCEVSKNTSSL